MTHYLMLSGLAALGLLACYGLIVLSYITVLRWLGWNTTSQSNGHDAHLLRAWGRCHALMAAHRAK